MKKILIISEYSVHNTIGGTELYVDILINELLEKNYEVVFITKGKDSKVLFENKVNKNGKYYDVYFLPNRKFLPEEIKQNIVSSTWPEIYKIICNKIFDIINIHTDTTFFNIRHIELLHFQFKNIILTSHVSDNFCLKGDMILFNSYPCDGKISIKCTFCYFSKGIFKGVSNVKHRYDLKILKKINILNNLSIKIIATSEWQARQLILNGYNEKLITVIKQFLDPDMLKKVDHFNVASNKLVIGFIGRLTKAKGAELLINILKYFLKQKSSVSFVFAIPESNSSDLFYDQIKKIVELYPNRVKLLTNINIDNKSDFYNLIDVLLIPSFCLETGPLVLLEALASDIKVLAPDAGGPLDFDQKYPGKILFYLWNNSFSVIKKLNELSLVNRFTNNTSTNSIEKNKFVNDHIKVFND